MLSINAERWVWRITGLLLWASIVMITYMAVSLFVSVDLQAIAVAVLAVKVICDWVDREFEESKNRRLEK